jgi:hypothetical protein
LFVALRAGVCRLQQYYQDLPDLRTGQLPIFPTPTTYKSGDSTIAFDYVGVIRRSDAFCPTFLAIDTQENTLIVVKFAERYCKEAHEALASEQCAPQLLYFGDIWDSEVEAKGCQPYRMITMESIRGVTLADRFSAASVVR